ncbi:hypothetical protein HH212_26760 (plasmid) [Massilia forsythiae]|uniref:Uncharacterized protein n=1 Tax=Massilia forsythiae TaxID=2728020 RepID=A0A7Z2ZVP1_9BURK|nr:hypothetical protein [Massilia forsythiae]QJE03699.1 hypothetical protein HH212_26760 [Massilia forsythiae]
MFKKQTLGDHVTIPTKNRLPDVKKWAWAYVVTALLYLVAGGPPQFGFLFLMMTFFAGALILQNSERNEQVAIAAVMTVFLLVNAIFLALPLPGFMPHSENLAVGFWIIDKLWYVSGIALFLPVLVDKFVKKTGGHRSWAIAVAFAGQFLLTLYLHNEKQEEMYAPVQCEHVVGLTCTPVAMPMSWYTRSTLAEDLVFGLQVVLLLAAFNKKDEEPVRPDTKQ